MLIGYARISTDALSNRTSYGLGASIWTTDSKRARAIAARLQTGMVWVNDVNVAFPQAPWYGVKSSGQGTNLSKYGLYEFTTLQHVNLDESPPAKQPWWFPYEAAE